VSLSLDKARAALSAAAEIDVPEHQDDKGLLPLRFLEPYNRLLNVAQIHAQIAQAEALERIAEVLLSDVSDSTAVRIRSRTAP
jgi:hypothetical protein